MLTITKARITQLDADNLLSLSNLEELDLDGNDLTAFNATAFEVSVIRIISTIIKHRLQTKVYKHSHA